MVTSILLLSFLLALPCSAYFRFTCPQRLVIERVDPLISPGKISGHVHTVSGGNGFGYTMDYDQARASTCTSCVVKEDLSNYWTPALYYKAPNGSLTLVPQGGLGDGGSGMNVYYNQQPGQEDTLKAFPPNFRMIAGNPFKRNTTGTEDEKAISFSCLDYAKGNNQYIYEMPKAVCPDGLRAQVYFPACWDGVNLDSSDHQSHMSYPIEGYDNGNCPSTHPVHFISLMYEVIWMTQNFKNEPNALEQPFVFAQGDPTGYGFHGDFVNGWDTSILQRSIDTCTDKVSGNLNVCFQPNEMATTQESEACTLPGSLDENIEGPLDALPGCNPITNGPEPSAYPSGSCPADANAKVLGSLTGPIKSSGAKGKLGGNVSTGPNNGNTNVGSGIVNNNAPSPSSASAAPVSSSSTSASSQSTGIGSTNPQNNGNTAANPQSNGNTNPQMGAPNAQMLAEMAAGNKRRRGVRRSLR